MYDDKNQSCNSVTKLPLSTPLTRSHPDSMPALLTGIEFLSNVLSVSGGTLKSDIAPGEPVSRSLSSFPNCSITGVKESQIRRYITQLNT